MKKTRLIAAALAALCICFSVASCETADPTTSVAPGTTGNPPKTQVGTEAPVTSGGDAVTGSNVNVTLNGADTTVKGEGAEFRDGTLSITKGGVYTLSGKLENGQVYVNVAKPEEVEIVLNGVEITSTTTAAIYVECAEKVKITAAAGTTNKLTDASSYKYEAGVDEPNACIYSADDMTIKGTGTLIVKGNYKNGISSKNDIKIKDLDLTVHAYNTGIRGKDSVEIESGKITVEAGNDGIKSSNDTEVGRGYILVSGGTIVIEAEDDGFQAETDITVKGGSLTISANGKEFNSAGTLNVDESCVK
ncbi:MAG: carbohydrate-binding domain-containing protein [Ruminococcaceae bacterium]|nr:carbohydrate-binding domain-containing protein [Oscillospiraceae bacterium]